MIQRALVSFEGFWGEIVHLPPWPINPSFGIESALWQSVSAPLLPASLPVAALLTGSLSAIEAAGEKAIEDGFTHAKIKLGPHSPSRALRDLLNKLKKKLRLRLDLNQKWNDPSFFSSFYCDDFEYIEEPAGDLATFPLPFALDESLRTDIPQPLMRKAAAWIFKPSLSGGPTTLLAWKKKAEGIPIILSSAHESGIGICLIALMSIAFDCPMPGLDTYRLLTQDLLKEPINISNGRYHLPSVISPC